MHLVAGLSLPRPPDLARAWVCGRLWALAVLRGPLNSALLYPAGQAGLTLSIDPSHTGN